LKALKKEDLLTSVVDLVPPSYRQQSKRLLTYLAENEHIDEKNNDVTIQGNSYNLIDFVSDLIAHRKRVESTDSHLYNVLKSSNFPKSLISSKQLLKKLNEHSP
jgi:hypothetical protein